MIITRKRFHIFIVCELAVMGWLVVHLPQAAIHSKTLSDHANEILARCASTEYKLVCYDNEIPKLMPPLTMEQAFEVTRLVQERDGEYWYCHVLGHKLSEQETVKDAHAWKDVVGRCPTGMCANGCIHGAFQARFKAERLADDQTESFKNEILDVCGDVRYATSSKMRQFACYHALGHLLMYATGADINESLRVCSDIASKSKSNFAQGCYDGAFMQIFQPLEPEDITLVEGIKPTKEELALFCGDFEGDQYASCWSEGWPLFFQKVTDPIRAVAFCAALSGARQEKKCYSGLFFAMVVHANFNEDRIVSFCNRLPPSKVEDCFAESTFRFISTDERLIDKAAHICELAPGTKVSDNCFSRLIERMTFVLPPHFPQLEEYCERFPAPFKEHCSSRLLDNVENE